MITDGYIDGEQAVSQMMFAIRELNHAVITLDKQDEFDLELFKEDLNTFNEMYQAGRDAAIAFGRDVREFPRRLRANTRLTYRREGFAR